MNTDEQFSEAVYVACPLRFDGYRFLHFYREIKNLPKGPDVFMDEACTRFRQDFILPDDTNLAMAVFFFLQRAHKDYGIPGEPNAPEDGKWFGNAGAWSHFYLAFLQLYTHHYPLYFNHHSFEPLWKRLTVNGTEHEVATQIRRELIGYRGSLPLAMRGVTGDELQDIAERASEKFWLKHFDLHENPELDRPDVILALSFKGNGFSEMMNSGSPPLWHPQSGGSNYLAEKTKDVLSSKLVFSMESDENRAVLFLLQLWLLRHPDQANYKSREHLIFCLLYLHLYREPLSEYFSRKIFAKRWQQFTFDDKEKVAANMRRNLARIRNEAAKAHPCERTLDKPDLS